MRRRELIRPDRGLQVRMVLVSILTPLLVLAGVVGLFALLEWPGRVGLGLAVAVGVGAVVKAWEHETGAPLVTAEQEPELHAVVERLCVRGDLPKPEIALHDVDERNSWILDPPGGTARLHVTRGLVEALEPAELEAVVAHELAHVANGDAQVMTLVGMPAMALRRGGSDAGFITPVVWIGILGARVLGVAGTVGTNALARYRELSADAGAAALTSRPSALASALMKVGDGRVARLPHEDLREAAARNAFNLLPIPTPDPGPDARFRDEVGFWVARLPLVRRLAATHPPVDRRVAALRRAEEQLQAR